MPVLRSLILSDPLELDKKIRRKKLRRRREIDSRAAVRFRLDLGLQFYRVASIAISLPRRVFLMICPIGIEFCLTEIFYFYFISNCNIYLNQVDRTNSWWFLFCERKMIGLLSHEF